MQCIHRQRSKSECLGLRTPLCRTGKSPGRNSRRYVLPSYQVLYPRGAGMTPEEIKSEIAFGKGKKSDVKRIWGTKPDINIIPGMSMA